MENSKPKIHKGKHRLETLEREYVEADGYKWLVRDSSLIGGLRQDLLGPNEREEHNFNAIKKYADLEGMFLDIGANLGGFAIKLSSLFKETWAFEPETYNYIGLCENIINNKLRNVQAFRIAVSDCESMVDITERGGGSKIADNDSTRNTFNYHKVLAKSLDSFDFPYKVSVIKIDTEGSEVPILKGAKNLIMAQRPAIIIESHEKTYHGNDNLIGQIAEIEKLLTEEYNYELEVLMETTYGDKHYLATPK